MKAKGILSLRHCCVIFLLMTLLPPAFCQEVTQLMACRKGWMTYSNACYQFNKYPISPRDDAEKRCWSNSSSLLTIENEEERNWITSQTMKYNTVQTWWIGLKGLDESYHWKHKTILTSYSPPFANEPDNANGKEDCAMISSRGFLRDEVCSRQQKFICKAKNINADESCLTKGYTGILIKSSNYCYWFVFLSAKSWDDAKQFCRSVQLKNSPEKVDLLSLIDHNEQIVVKGALNRLRAFGAAWWTGLRYDDGAKKYEYSDGTAYSAIAAPWLTREAIHNIEDSCGAIFSNGFVTVLACNVNIGYICKYSRVRPESKACPDNWIRAKDSCYAIDQSKSMSWAAADYACKTSGAHLLKTDSLDEKNWLEHIEALRFHSFWIGLHVRNGSKPGIFEWSDKTSLNKPLIRWYDGEVKGAHCTRLHVTTGNFFYSWCDRIYHNLACEYRIKPGQSSCLQAWRRNMQKCYYFSNSTRNSFYTAWKECFNAYSKQDSKGAMADVNYITIENSLELKFVQATAKSLNMGDLWLGLNNLGDGINWIWEGAPTVSSNTVSRSPLSGEPNMKYNCVSIFYRGLYKTRKCDSKLPFICEMKAKIKTNLASSVRKATGASLGRFVVLTLILTGFSLRS